MNCSVRNESAASLDAVAAFILLSKNGVCSRELVTGVHDSFSNCTAQSCMHAKVNC